MAFKLIFHKIAIDSFIRFDSYFIRSEKDYTKIFNITLNSSFLYSFNCKRVPSLAIGVPIRYIHSHAVILHRDDYENAYYIHYNHLYKALQLYKGCLNLYQLMALERYFKLIYKELVTFILKALHRIRRIKIQTYVKIFRKYIKIHLILFLCICIINIMKLIKGASIT